jgi:hypothetical protein
MLAPTNPMKVQQAKLEGTFLEITPAGRERTKLIAFYVTRDSEARRVVIDLIVVCCSNQCGEKASAAINSDIDLTLRSRWN